MEKSIHRIFKELKDRGIKPSFIEKETGLSNGYLAKMKRTDGTLGEEALDKLATFLDLSLNYVIRGEEAESEEPRVMLSDKSHKLEKELLDAYRTIAQLQKEIELLKNKKRSS